MWIKWGVVEEEEQERGQCRGVYGLVAVRSEEVRTADNSAHKLTKMILGRRARKEGRESEQLASMYPVAEKSKSTL